MRSNGTLSSKKDQKKVVYDFSIHHPLIIVNHCEIKNYGLWKSNYEHEILFMFYIHQHIISTKDCMIGTCGNLTNWLWFI